MKDHSYLDENEWFKQITNKQIYIIKNKISI